ncbi:hypothetical protein [Methylibium sp.]|uniref:hypothetical protein n=1 Tax=Methylibium sp. TaxID=2067992 RepID=UPI002DBC6647|nr:hypothetical protein [Methylibium sp.]
MLALALFAAWRFASRWAIEGDDLNVLFGMQHLDVLSTASVYRYGWQPLAYDLFFAAMRAGLTAQGALAFGALLGGAGFALIVIAAVDLYRRAAPGRPWGRAGQAALIVAVACQELWITALYFNTTALGLPFFVVALWAALRSGLAAPGSAASAAARGALVGASLAVASLMRLDYATAGALLLLLLGQGPQRGAAIAAFAAMLALAFGGFALLRPEWPQLIFDVVTRYGGETFPGWTAYKSFLVLVATAGTGLLAVLLVLPGHGWRRLRALATPRWLLLWLSMLPMLVPALNLYSGKYLIPVLVSLLLLGFRGWGRQLPGGRAAPSPGAPSALRLGLGWTLVVLLCVGGLSHPRDVKRTPVAAWFTAPFEIDTHDGIRYVGFFARTAREFADSQTAHENMRLMRDLGRAVRERLHADAANPCPRELVLAMPPRVWFWAPILVELGQPGWRLADWRHEHSASFVFGTAGAPRRLTLHGPQAPVAGAASTLIDLSDIYARGEESATDYGRRKQAELARAPVCAVVAAQ